MKNKLAALGVSLLVVAAIVVTFLLRDQDRQAVPSSAAQPETSAADGGLAPDTPKAQPMVRLSTAQLEQYGIETAPAGPGRLRIEITLPGEVALNADRVAHVVPRVPGVAREVRKNLGETVRQDEVMAVLESRELADNTAALLAARERVILAQSNFSREEKLWEKKISAEQDYIQARNSLAEARIGLRAAEQKLRALGFSESYINQLPGRQDRAMLQYEMTSPFDGTVTEKHISLGEVLKDDAPAFVIADLSSVWVNLDVHQKDLPFVRVGQKAIIAAGTNMPEREGRVSFLDPIATETNRTIHARVVLPNADGRYRPGLFVSGRVEVEELHVPVLVPNDALLMVDGRMCVFVREQDAFRLQAVATGRKDANQSEITDGLAAGQTVVIRGAFTLKSELGKPEAEH